MLTTMDGTQFAPPEWDRILRAAMKNDSIGIRRLVEEEGVSASHSNAVKQSALHIASIWGNVEAVEELVKQNAAMNAQNTMTGATPLHCAAQSMKGEKARRVMCMEMLIAGGADISVADFFGKVAGDYVLEDDPYVARRLGLLPSRPPLFSAIDEGQLEEVQKLVAVSSNNDNDKPPCYEEPFMGETPFQHAFNLLIPSEEEEENTVTGDRSILVEILKTLLEAGASVNAMGAGNLTNPVEAMENPVLPPLSRVCSALQEAYKNKEDATLLDRTCHILLEHQAAVTPDVEQMLHSACRKNELQFAKLLIEVVKIDPNIKNRQGMTPIHFAARSGKIEMVQYLLSLPNVDVSVQDDRGHTALHYANVNNKLDVVSLLEKK